MDNFQTVRTFFEENENVTVLVVSIVYLLALGYTNSVHAIWSFTGLFIIFFYAFKIPLSMAGLFSLLGSLIVQVSSYPGFLQMKPSSRFEPFTPEVISEEQSVLADGSMPITDPSVVAAPSATTKTDSMINLPSSPPSDSTSSTPMVDLNKTIMSSISSLTPTQIESMTSDTKELIQTQKSLLETVKQLAPVVSQGREMLETFKGYFGNTNDLVSMLKSDSSVTK